MSVSFQRFDIFSMITPWQIVVKCVIFFFFFRSRQEKEVISLKKLLLITIMIIIITIIVSCNVKIDFSYILQLYKQLQRCQREQAINYCNDYTLKKPFLVQ